MEWIRAVGVIVVGGFVSSMTDWFFSGILFHEKYNAYPEVWRRPDGAGESKAILGSIGLSLVTGGAFVSILRLYGIAGWERTLLLAFLLWCAGCVPVFVTNALFVKFHPLVVVSITLGWLVKLEVLAAASVLLLG
jgi:hypothetical protein